MTTLSRTAADILAYTLERSRKEQSTIRLNLGWTTIEQAEHDLFAMGQRDLNIICVGRDTYLVISQSTRPFRLVVEL